MRRVSNKCSAGWEALKLDSRLSLRNTQMNWRYSSVVECLPWHAQAFCSVTSSGGEKLRSKILNNEVIIKKRHFSI
jgi:hypothetical protein